jgi:hypothetical protein
MFEYTKIKEELEQIKCPTHNKTATVIFVDGKVKFENVCCEEHRQNLNEALPHLEEEHGVEDILEDVY